jgi:hypothetical protein
MGTAPIIKVTVGLNTSGGLAIVKSAYKTGYGQLLVPISTAQTGDTLVAFSSLDGPAGGGMTDTVSGGGLTWKRVAQENGQLGDAEIWTATAPGLLTNATIISKPKAYYAQQFTLLVFAGAAGVGASGAASGPSGTPSVSLTTDAAGSLTYAVGEDWDNPIARTLGPAQTMTKQWVDGANGDTFWVQQLVAPSTSAGQSETLNDVAPTTDQWNMAAVEVEPSTPPAPAVLLVNPANDETVSGTVPVAAVARDAAPVRSVRFLVDGQPMGAAVSRFPYHLRWNTTTLSSGTHTLESVVSDTLGRTAVTTERVEVVNPAPAMTCFVLSARTSAHGTGSATTAPIHTASAGEQLLAFVSANGSARPHVSGSGLSWRLVRGSGGGGRSASIWAAEAHRVRGDVRVTARGGHGGVDVSLIAIEGTDGLGASVASSRSSGAFDLATTRDTSLVFAVGTGEGTAPLPPNWARLSVHTGAATTWVDYTNQPASAAGSHVRFAGGADAGWKVSAVELPGDGN